MGDLIYFKSNIFYADRFKDYIDAKSSVVAKIRNSVGLP